MQVQDSDSGSTSPEVPQHEHLESITRSNGIETGILQPQVVQVAEPNFTRQQGPQGQQASLPSPHNLYYTSTPYNDFNSSLQQRPSEYQPVNNHRNHTSPTYSTTNQFQSQQQYRPPSYNSAYGNDNDYYANEHKNDTRMYGTNHIQQPYQHTTGNTLMITPDVTIPAPIWIAIGSLAGLTAAAAVRWLNGGDFTLLPPPYLYSSSLSSSAEATAHSTKSDASTAPDTAIDSRRILVNQNNNAASEEKSEEDSDEEDDDNEDEESEEEDGDENFVVRKSIDMNIAKEESVKVVVDNTLVLKSLLEGMNSSLERQEGLVRRLVSDRERDITNQSMSFLLNHDNEKKSKQKQNETDEQVSRGTQGEGQHDDQLTVQYAKGLMQLPVSKDLMAIETKLKLVILDLKSLKIEMERLSVPRHQDDEVQTAERDEKLNGLKPHESLINNVTEVNSEIQAIQSGGSSQESTEGIQSTCLPSSMNIISSWQPKLKDVIRSCADILDQVEVIATKYKQTTIDKNVQDTSTRKSDVMPHSVSTIDENNGKMHNVGTSTNTTSNDDTPVSLEGNDDETASFLAATTSASTQDGEGAVETVTLIEEVAPLSVDSTKDVEWSAQTVTVIEEVAATKTASTQDVARSVDAVTMVGEGDTLNESMITDFDKTMSPAEVTIQALRKLVVDNENTKQLQSSIQVLYLYIYNLSMHPKKNKYRKINTASGSTFQQQIVTTIGATALLQAVGFLQSSQNSSLLEWDPATLYKQSSSSTYVVNLPNNEIEDIYVDLSKQVASALKLIRSKLVSSMSSGHTVLVVTETNNDKTKFDTAPVATAMAIFNEVLDTVGLRSHGTEDETLSSV